MWGKFAVTSGLVSFLSFSTAFADPFGFSQLVVFGDSLSDTGNAAAGTAGVYPGPVTNYAPGEFTDGSLTLPSTSGPHGIWVDQIAPKLGVSVPQPAFASSGGTNYAVGAANTGTNPNYPGLLQPPYLDQQVGAFLKSVNQHAPSNALYAFWAGANDIDNNPTDASVPAKAATDVFSNIISVAAAGGKDFLWFNLPPLGETPAAIKAGGAAVQVANADSAAFNAQWKMDLAKLDGMGIDTIGVDIGDLFNLVVADHSKGCTAGPGDPLCFANITDSAQGNPLVDPNTYLFWDDRHPTTAGQALIADAALAALQGGGTAVPEPGSWSLVVFALVCFGGAFCANRYSKR